MSKRKPLKPSHGSKIAGPKVPAKAQRAAQAVVRSPSNNPVRPPRAGSTESPPMHIAGEQEALLVENPATTLQPELPRQAELPPERHEPQQEALPVEKPAADLPDDGKPTMTGNEPKDVPDFSSAAGNVWAYQAKLLEMAQANMQFAFEFPQRLATIRSPGEFFSVIAEFTDKRIVMSQKYSKEIAEFSALR